MDFQNKGIQSESRGRWRPWLSCLLIAALTGLLLPATAGAKKDCNKWTCPPDYTGLFKDPVKPALIILGATVGAVVTVVLVKRSHRRPKEAAASAVPARLDFGRVPVGGSKTQLVAIKNNGNTALELSHKLVPGECFSLLRPPGDASSIAGRAQAGISVVFQPKAQGKCAERIETTVRSPGKAGSRLLVIPLKGQGWRTAADGRL